MGISVVTTFLSAKCALCRCRLSRVHSVRLRQVSSLKFEARSTVVLILFCACISEQAVRNYLTGSAFVFPYSLLIVTLTHGSKHNF